MIQPRSVSLTTRYYYQHPRCIVQNGCCWHRSSTKNTEPGCCSAPGLTREWTRQAKMGRLGIQSQRHKPKKLRFLNRFGGSVLKCNHAAQLARPQASSLRGRIATATSQSRKGFHLTAVRKVPSSCCNAQKISAGALVGACKPFIHDLLQSKRFISHTYNLSNARKFAQPV